MTAQPQTTPGARDFLARPTSAFFWWGLPFLAGFATNFLPLARDARTLVWAVALAWMGAGCALNAARCHRLHCYISAPVLFLGALGAVLGTLGLDPLGPPTASYAINASVAIALISLLVEPVWGKYRSSRRS
ncbi:MAG TPA: hypothetical protein VMU93_11850 [Caulobacteraceae bacterium]|nr:hypothetical protein [Caulobacteraceae bacterium]